MNICWRNALHPAVLRLGSATNGTVQVAGGVGGAKCGAGGAKTGAGGATSGVSEPKTEAGGAKSGASWTWRGSITSSG